VLRSSHKMNAPGHTHEQFASMLKFTTLHCCNGVYTSNMAAVIMAE